MTTDAATPAGEPGDDIPERQRVVQSRMRRAVGDAMVASKREVPHFYVTADIRTDALHHLLAGLERERGVRITITAAIIRALSIVLPDHRALNAHWAGDGVELIRSVNVGVAMPVGDGLLAPAILDAGRFDLVETAVALRDLIDRARAGRLRASELSDGTFTLSNLGMYEVSSFAAIVIPPQVAILAAGRSAPRLGLDADGQVVQASTTTLTVSADHRAVDGVHVARFLGDLRATIESPRRLLGV